MTEDDILIRKAMQATNHCDEHKHLTGEAFRTHVQAVVRAAQVQQSRPKRTLPPAITRHLHGSVPPRSAATEDE